MSAQTSGIIRQHYQALSGIITHFPVFPTTKTRLHLGAALLAALLAAPQAWAAPCGGNSFTDWWGDPGCGGAGSGNTGSTSVILDYDFIDGDAYGGYSDKDDAAAIDTTGKANGNTLSIASGGTAWWAFGGFANADNSGGGAEANDNKVFIDGGTVIGNLYGGYVRGENSKVSRNTVTISAGTVESYVRGGYAADGYSTTVTDNTVNISGGSVTGNVFGGYSEGENDATDNTVNISGGSVTGTVYGGYAEDDGNPKDNAVTISGGTVTGDVYGGYAENWYSGTGSHDATGNTITLAGGTVTGNVLGGASPTGGEDVAGNTLKVQAKGLSVGGEVRNFEKLAFTLPADIANGQTMLSTGGQANFPATVTSVSITVTGKPALKENDEITLIAAGSSLSIKDYPKSLSAGGFVFALSDDGKNLIAKITKVLPPGNATAVPTLGEVGLLLISFTLAGAAAPALRRRKKQGKKAYTRC